MSRSPTRHLGVFDKEISMTTAQMFLITLEVVLALVGVAVVISIFIRSWRRMRAAPVLRIANAFELCVD